MKYTVQLKNGATFGKCDVFPCPWLPGFLDIAPGDGWQGGLFNASEILSICEELSEEERPTSKRERIIREPEGERE